MRPPGFVSNDCEQNSAGLREWLSVDMSAAQPPLHERHERYVVDVCDGDVAKLFDGVRARPVRQR